MDARERPRFSEEFLPEPSFSQKSSYTIFLLHCVMSTKLASLGTELDARHVQRDGNGQWTIPVAKGRRGFFVIAAEWCGYCTRLANSMHQARSIGGFPCYYVQGDRGLGGHLMKAMQAQGFPTVFIIDVNGGLSHYEGERTAEALCAAVAPVVTRSLFSLW